MFAKIISAGALTLLLTGGALAYNPQPHNIYAGHSKSAQPQLALQTQQFAACRPAFSLPKWQRAKGTCSALSNDMPREFD